MYRRPALAELAAFARLQRAVRRSIDAGTPQPFTSCPVANAYDLRPRSSPSRPSVALTLKALAFMGYRRPTGHDKGVYIDHCVKKIAAFIIAADDIEYADYELLNLVVSFRIYAELKEGRRTKWKLIRA